MGFVTLRMSCYLPPTTEYNRKLPCGFFLPRQADATVTDVTIENMSRDVVYATVIVPNEETSGFGGGKGNADALTITNDPELFQLQLQDVQAGDRLTITTTWFQPLRFDDGLYLLKVPLEIPSQALENPNMPLSSILDIQCTVNSGTADEVRFSCPSHPVDVLSQEPGRVQFAGAKGKPWNNADFEVGYKVWQNAIMASCNVQPPDKTLPDPRGTFAVSVAPPAPDATAAFVRSVVFVVDRSGSMHGEPIEYARDAISTGLEMLAPEDEVGIIAYDHEQVSLFPSLLPASAETQAVAKRWVGSHLEARGMTDIMTPLLQALEMLKAAKGVPYVFLLTDGAVDNERDICQKVEAFNTQHNPSGVLLPRINTFAIGPYCNHFFLKQLAILGRGAFDVAFRPTNIRSQMTRMLTAAAKPVLTDVALGIEGLTSCELYPFPIPDVFCGMPLLVAGKYEGVWPESVVLHGKLPSGEIWTQTVYTTAAAQIPLDKVVVKQRLDVLTSRAWLQQDKKLQRQVVDASIATGVPCAHTTMVGFPVTHDKWREMKQQQAAGKRISPAKLAIGGAAAVVVLGATAALAFGDVGATLGNLAVGDVMSGFGGLDPFNGMLNFCDCSGVLLFS
ncbi:hypothetical protein WJX72_011563 [[Myrmecia] bisecta]|uniref:VWFA domain-containing protein n=1 Tax=[Myrmecia] bisecta TaxID=41462 RepID=A0AAW1P6I5_9CHLO